MHEQSLTLDGFDHRAAAFVADPYPELRQIQTVGPVLWSPRMNAWIVSRHEDVRAGFRDLRLSSDRISPFANAVEGEMRELVLPLCENLKNWQVFNDPPEHMRLRGLLVKSLSPRAIEKMRPSIEAIVDELIDGMVGQAGEIDFYQAFAYPLPAMVIAQMIGVPRDDVDKLKKWSDDLGQFVLTSRLNRERYVNAANGMREMTEYFDDFVQRRAAEGTGDDITAALISARDNDNKLSHDEVVATLLSLLFAGHETTTTLLANGLFTLFQHPDALAAVRGSDPDDPALVRAVDELLRYEGPALSMARVVAEDFEWHGQTLRKGQRVFLFQSGANRDPRVFEDPDNFDITRKNASDHVTFGYGIHFCAGAVLAKLEARIALPRLLTRLPNIRLADHDPKWSDALLTRALEELWIKV